MLKSHRLALLLVSWLAAAALAQPAPAPQHAKPPASGVAAISSAPDLALTGQVTSTKAGDIRTFHFEGLAKNIGNLASVDFSLKITCNLSAAQSQSLKNTCPQMNPSGLGGFTTVYLKALLPGESVPISHQIMTVNESKTSWTAASYTAHASLSLAYLGAPVAEKNPDNNTVGFTETRHRRQ